MAITDIELEIRSALEGEASLHPVPPELRESTLEAARAVMDPPATRPGRWLRVARLRRSRRWVYAVAALAVIPVLYLVGTHVTSTTVGPTASAVNGLAGVQGDVNPSARSNQVAGSILSGAGSPEGGTAATPAPASSSGTAPAPGFQQSIVRTASVSVRVPKGGFASSWAQALAVAGRFGGLVSDSNAQTVNGRLASGDLTIQVPSANLDQVLAALGGLGTVTSQSTTSQDQSGQVANDATQLTALQAEESEYLQLLPQAKSTADILAIEQPLNNVQQQIQTLQASQAYLQNQVAMATLQATLSEPGAQPPPVKPEGRLAKAWQQARTGVTEVLAGFIVALGYLLAPVLVLLLAWAGVRRLRRRVV